MHFLVAQRERDAVAAHLDIDAAQRRISRFD